MALPDRPQGGSIEVSEYWLKQAQAFLLCMHCSACMKSNAPTAADAPHFECEAAHTTAMLHGNTFVAAIEHPALWLLSSTGEETC
jgi:hypothetical protein